MPASMLWSAVRNAKFPIGSINPRYIIKILGILFLFLLVCIELGPLNLFQPARAISFAHTIPTADYTCNEAFYSPDGNPFTLCPGPYPRGGNCVWWAWEQWHLLGYDLPLNWGNAADWIVDAERYSLPIGTVPRVGSIAVFPRADGVWAFGPPGHVAFVTWVSPDSNTFNVTYQNYGDPTPMYIGKGYDVSIINESRFQNSEMRFIYFPKLIDPNLFAHLPGVNGNNYTAIMSANSLLPASLLALGSLSEQEFNADFTGSGLSDLLLYNRQKGTLNVLAFSNKQQPNTQNSSDNTLTPKGVSLSDAHTPANGWGSNLDIHVGDFTGAGHSEILLYDRVIGSLQFLSLSPDLKIQKHVTIAGWGPGWELYIGRFDGQHSNIFMYNRFANSEPTSNPTPSPVVSPPRTQKPLPPRPSPTSKPKPLPSPTPTPTPSPTPKPSPTPSPTPKPSPTPSPTPKAHPTPTATPSPDPTLTATPDPTVTPHPTATPKPKHKRHKHQAKPTPTPTATSDQDIFGLLASPTPSIGSGELSGSFSDWQKQGRTANILLLNFNKDFSVLYAQPYSLWHNAWEVYVGHFVNANQDGIFLYDRTIGEARIMSFDKNLQITNYQEMHNLAGNWEIHSGDFNGSGHDQVLMYDPTTGDAQILVFAAKDLSLSAQKTYSGWGKNLVLYVGHFGMSTLGIMLYDPNAGRSTFMAFDKSLKIAHTYKGKSWDKNWQILIGAFLDRSRCLANHTCATGDDILVLNRKNGQIEQYIFSFVPPVRPVDNHIRAIMGDSEQEAGNLAPIAMPPFRLLTTLDTSIRGEELY